MEGHGKYLLKPRSNESTEHLFLIFDIAKYLESFVDKVEVFETGKPDIVFEVKGKQYAIEIETGLAYEKSRNKLFKKVILLNQNYKRRWFFVLTNRYLKNKYAKLGPVLLRRDIVPSLNKFLFRK